MMIWVQSSYEAAEVEACGDGLMRPKTFLSLIIIGRLLVLLRIYAGRYVEAYSLGSLGNWHWQPGMIDRLVYLLPF